MIGIAGMVMAALLFGVMGYRWGRTDERDSQDHLVAIGRPVFAALDLMPNDSHLMLDVVRFEDEDGDEYVTATVKAWES